MEFRKSSGFQRILNFEINLLLIDTKISRNTKVLVDGVKKLNERHPFVTHSILNTMDEVSKSAANYIRKLSEYNTLSSSSLSDEMIELFKNLGVSNTKILCVLYRDNFFKGTYGHKSQFIASIEGFSSYSKSNM